MPQAKRLVYIIEAVNLNLICSLAVLIGNQFVIDNTVRASNLIDCGVLAAGWRPSERPLLIRLNGSRTLLYARAFYVLATACAELLLPRI
ncbi:hypothetical protein OUZ56_008460 [Daphnia magna]|uniref:Uncharacterized protein n=1 Tax=Daphnia magna TaxID=35525 RepID=A0ABR0AD21_9CRUS|nr:hypothetical protein OUZ56_008460 [Daphnia magna]